jgi:osmotically-inducible protein OsmY
VGRIQSFALGFVLGAGWFYFFDRDRGARRRALVRDQLAHAGHEMDDAARSGARHIRNRATGAVRETAARWAEREVDDRVLVERVRSRVGRVVRDASELEVYATDGEITLVGNVASDEVQAVVRAAKEVRGVERVDNRLDVVSRGQPVSGRPGRP